MDKVPYDNLFLPEPGLRHLPCGVHVREWNYCVVYVRSPHSDQSVTQKFYFTFYATGDYYLDEVVTLVEQWTHWRGDSFAHFASDSHEFRRARKMACKTVGTYRRKYLAKHGSEPNPLLLKRTLDDSLTPIKKQLLFSRPDHSGSAQQTFKIEDKPL